MGLFRIAMIGAIVSAGWTVAASAREGGDARRDPTRAHVVTRADFVNDIGNRHVVSPHRALARPVARYASEVDVLEAPLVDPLRRRIEVVHRPIAYPSAVVPEALAKQPVYTHLIELQVVNTPIYLDPEENFMDAHWGGVDEEHYLVEAQRVAARLRARPARVVERPPQYLEGEQPAVEPVPLMILEKPNLDGDAPKAIPSVPAPPEEESKKVVRAE